FGAAGALRGGNRSGRQAGEINALALGAVIAGRCFVVLRAPHGRGTNTTARPAGMMRLTRPRASLNGNAASTPGMVRTSAKAAAARPVAMLADAGSTDRLMATKACAAPWLRLKTSTGSAGCDTTSSVPRATTG